MTEKKKEKKKKDWSWSILVVGFKPYLRNPEIRRVLDEAKQRREEKRRQGI